MGFGFLIPLFIVGAVVYAIYHLIGSNQNNTTNTESKNALEILNDRFAKGEIDEAEYERIKNKILK